MTERKLDAERRQASLGNDIAPLTGAIARRAGRLGQTRERTLKVLSWLGAGQWRRAATALRSRIKHYIPPPLIRMIPKRARVALNRTILPKGRVVQALAKAELIGELESVSRGVCRGWAVRPSRPKQRVLVDIVVDGLTVATRHAQGQRTDLAEVLGTDGRHGFSVRLPPGIDNLPSTDLIARCHETGLPLVRSSSFGHGIVHQGADRENSDAIERDHLYGPPLNRGPSVTIIVINRDGATHLQNLFESFSRYNTYESYEILVVDHNSSDTSRSVCEHWAEKLNIRFEQRDKNYSFSESNNFAAERSSSDLLLFLNNDIILCQNIIGRMVSYIEDEEIGLLGLRLLSPPEISPEADDTRAEPKLDWAQFTQHLGVKFSFDQAGRPFSYYEVPLSRASAATAHSACWVPAVTAACMMMRKADFDRLGGFSEEYFYGGEDVDLCLLAMGQLQKRAVCANDLVALHHRAATRGNASSEVREIIKKNRNVLERRFGKQLLGIRRQEWFSDDVFFQNTGPKVAILIECQTSHQPGRDDVSAAFELGEALSTRGVQVEYLERARWDDHCQSDVVISISPDFNPLERTSISPHQMVIAWPRDALDNWLTAPWIDAFDDIVCVSDSIAAAFSKRLSREFLVSGIQDAAAVLERLGSSLRIAVRVPNAIDSSQPATMLADLIGQEVLQLGHRPRRSMEAPAEASLQIGDDATIEIGERPSPSTSAHHYQPLCFISTSLNTPEEEAGVLAHYDAVVFMSCSMHERLTALDDNKVSHLFDSDEALEAAIVRRADGSWMPRDLAKFREQLALALRPLVEQWHADQMDWTNIPSPMRSH